MSGTIRSRTEAIIAECDAYLRQTLTESAYNPAVGMCERIRVAADDTLTDLDQADSVFNADGTCHMPRLREIPDPDSRGAT